MTQAVDPEANPEPLPAGTPPHFHTVANEAICGGTLEIQIWRPTPEDLAVISFRVANCPPLEWVISDNMLAQLMANCAYARRDAGTFEVAGPSPSPAWHRGPWV